MARLIDVKIEEYCQDHSTPPSQALQELSEKTVKESEDHGMMVGHIEGSLLKMLVKISGAKQILEIGTFTGYSALAMAEGLPDDGILITCDKDEETSGIAHTYWNKSPHGIKIMQMMGDAVETLKMLQEQFEKGERTDFFDLVFIDADKSSYPVYWDLSISMLKKGGIIAIDNVLRGGRVVNPDSDHSKKTDEFNKKVIKDDRVDVLMLPVRDGVTVAVKK